MDAGRLTSARLKRFLWLRCPTPENFRSNVPMTRRWSCTLRGNWQLENGLSTVEPVERELSWQK